MSGSVFDSILQGAKDLAATAQEVRTTLRPPPTVHTEKNDASSPLVVQGQPAAVRATGTEPGAKTAAAGMLAGLPTWAIVLGAVAGGVLLVLAVRK